MYLVVTTCANSARPGVSEQGSVKVACKASSGGV